MILDHITQVYKQVTVYVKTLKINEIRQSHKLKKQWPSLTIEDRRKKKNVQQES